MVNVSVPCEECTGKLRFGDDFCPQCGAAVPKAVKRALRNRLDASDPSARAKSEQLKKSSDMLLVLAVLFVIGGAAMYALALGTTEKALADLASLPSTQQLTIEGKVYTVEALRALIEREPVQAFALNALLAAIMVGLYFWSRRAALPALVTALAIFVTVHVVSAVLDPSTIAMGIFVKVFAVVVFVRGIRAALEARQLERGIA